jgi:ferritin
MDDRVVIFVKKTNMISETMEAALNKQIELEGYASYLYLSMASWCDQKGLSGCAEFMHRQSNEERMHMMKIFHYISEVDGRAISPGIAKPPMEWPGVPEMFGEVFRHEQKVTASIYELLNQSIAEHDYATQNFLQWYVSEQREEEALMRTILDKIKLIGNGPMSLYYIDKEIAAINAQAMTQAEGEEA